MNRVYLGTNRTTVDGVLTEQIGQQAAAVTTESEGKHK